MSSRAHASTALALAVALFAMPILLNQCAALCEARYVAANATAEPPCHHHSATTPTFGQTPGPCGHDHAGIVVSTAAVRLTGQTFLASIGVVPSVAIANAAVVTERTVPSASPPPDPVALHLSSSLRL